MFIDEHCAEGAVQLDLNLGDPWEDQSAVSYYDSLKFDKESLFPNHQFRAINKTGLQNLYVPKEFGGKLSDFFALVLSIRTVARRDLTVAIAHGKTFLGAICVWFGDTNFAKQHVAPMVMGGVRACPGDSLNKVLEAICSRHKLAFRRLQGNSAVKSG